MPIGKVQSGALLQSKLGWALITLPNVRPALSVSSRLSTAVSGALPIVTATVYSIRLPTFTLEPLTGLAVLAIVMTGVATMVCALALFGAQLMVQFSLPALIEVLTGIGPGLVGATT